MRGAKGTSGRAVAESAPTAGAGVWTIPFRFGVPMALRTILAGIRLA